MQSLYEKSVHWKVLEKEGFVFAAEVARRFTLAAEMDRAIGMRNCAAGWHRGKRPSRLAERACGLWLDANQDRDQKAVAAEEANVASSVVASPTEAKTLLVMCDQSTMKKVKAVLSIMSVEFVDL